MKNLTNSAAIFIALSALTLAAGCNSSKTEENLDEVCAEILCSGHGMCGVNADKQPVCVCETGYHLNVGDLTSCVENVAGTDACNGVTCGGYGTCAVKADNSAVVGRCNSYIGSHDSLFDFFD